MTCTLIIREEAKEEMARAYLYHETIQNVLEERFLS